MAKRTLVCIIAEARAAELTWPSFKKNVLAELDADLCLCVSDNKNYYPYNPYVQHAKHLFVEHEPMDWQKAYKDLAPSGDWEKLSQIGGQWLGPMFGQGGSSAILIYFRWLLLNHIITLDYDRYVITRSDFVWMCPHPPIELLDESFAWIPDGEHYGGVTDRHIVLSKDNLAKAINFLYDIMFEPKTLLAAMREAKPQDGWNLEQFIAFQLTRRKVPVRFFPYVMFAVRPEGGSTRWSIGDWSERLRCYIKYPWEYEEATRFSHDIKTRADWDWYLKP